MKKTYCSSKNHQIQSHLTAASATNPDGFKANILFKALEKAMQEDTDNLIAKVRGIYAFRVNNGPGGSQGYWIVDAKTGTGSVEFNGKSKSFCFSLQTKQIYFLKRVRINRFEKYFNIYILE